MPPERTKLRDRVLLACFPHRLFHERRLTVVDQLACDAVGGGADAGDGLECVGVDEWRDGCVDAEHGFCRALIAPAALRLPGDCCHVEQQSAEFEVHISQTTVILLGLQSDSTGTARRPFPWSGAAAPRASPRAAPRPSAASKTDRARCRHRSRVTL